MMRRDQQGNMSVDVTVITKHWPIIVGLVAIGGTYALSQYKLEQKADRTEVQAMKADILTEFRDAMRDMKVSVDQLGREVTGVKNLLCQSKPNDSQCIK